MSAPKIKTTKPVIPMIYAYTTPEIARHDGWIKIGYTEQEVEKRLDQQTKTADVEYHEEWRGKAEFDDGSGETFTDHDFHRHLLYRNVERKENTEWFHILPRPAWYEFNDFRERKDVLIKEQSVTFEYTLRKEQEEAVSKTLDYMYSHQGGEFLWNAKPRFGKTLAVYDLVKRMKAQKVLVLTNRPSVGTSWYSDYTKFARKNMLFVTRSASLQDRLLYTYVCSDDSVQLEYTPYLEFESLQDLKGSVYFGGKYEKFKKLSETEWDLLVIDEAHEGVDTFKTEVALDHINRKFTLHLSGTPFRALASNKFAEDAIFNWTYADEQKAKEKWYQDNEDYTEQNPYANLPQMNLFTYQMSEMIQDVIKKGIEINGETEEYAFDLNEFFAVSDNDKRFVHEVAVNKFLDALTTQTKYPFSTPELRDELKHTVWLLDRVESVRALAKKLQNHDVFKDYEIISVAGDGSIYEEDDVIRDAFTRVRKGIENNSKTITLTVQQLTTGVTIPEWTGVLMLSNVESSSLYMQTAFRVQNPCLFHEGSKTYRKERSYIFDFNPARTLIIYEQIANDLSPNTSNGKGNSEERKENIKTLLNFFPVIGEDSDGEMVELDATQVLSIPRKIKSTEVVNRGFLSNFLFQNISKIFSAPSVIVDILNKLPEADEGKTGKKDIEVDEDTKEELSIDENGDTKLDESQIEQQVNDIFGEKIYNVEEAFNELDSIKTDSTIEEQTSILDKMKESITSNIQNSFIEAGSNKYGNDFTRGDQKRIERTIETDINYKFDKAQKNYEIEKKKIEDEKDILLNKAQSEEEVSEIKAKADEKHKQNVENFKSELVDVTEETKKDIAKKIATSAETHKCNVKKQSIEEDIRAHLRGFSRTIPSFLMAYGTNEICLANFDSIIPDDVFKDVTSISIEEFRFLRDGGSYTNKETGKIEYYEGHLFDEVVFDDSVQEFLNKKRRLVNYFNESNDEDIFDYIPPQRTNQIFTPKNVVKEMVDLLEQENPGCFDDDTKTFADLYMKSGLYIAEIVKRLFNSEKMKDLYPDENERLNHIFEKQVYGLAPTEIIYRICLSFILGFDEEVSIHKHNIKLCDTLPYAKDGTLDKKLEELFDL